MKRRALLAACALPAIVIACGSRGPLDDTAAEAGGDASTEANVEGGPGIVIDASREAGPAACAACVLGTCGQGLVDCLGADACVGVFGCVATTCLPGLGDSDGGSGGLDTQCLLGCAAQSPAGALQVLGLFQCVTGTCSPDCGSLLGGLGGSGLGGLLGGGQRFAPAPRPDRIDALTIDRATFDEAFSPLLTSVEPVR